MNKLKIFSLATAFSLTLTAFPMLVHGDEAEYAPEDDPLVSLSYITEIVAPVYDKKIDDLEKTVETLTETLEKANDTLDEYKQIIDAIEKELGIGNLSPDDTDEDTYEDVTEDTSGDTTEDTAPVTDTTDEPDAQNPQGNYFEVVYLKNGAKIMADSPCEIILRSGSAIAVSAIVNGLNDMTDGTELLGGYEIPLFHHLLVPRGGDGRGIQITSEESYIMVRGDYSIVEE